MNRETPVSRSSKPVASSDTFMTNPVSRTGRTTAILITCLLGVGATAAGVTVAARASGQADTSRIVPGVRVADVAVGGLTADEAKEKVRAWARTQAGKAVTFQAPQSGRKWNITLAEAGGRFDIDGSLAKALSIGKEESWWDRVIYGQRERNITIKPEFRLSEAALGKQIDRIGKIVHIEPKNARGKVSEDGLIEVVAPEQKGIRLDAAATKAALLKGGIESLRNGGRATLVVAEEAPAVTSDMLLQVQHPLVALDPEYPSTRSHVFTTSYGSSSSNRRHNIELATSHINGTILAPGEVFSYNDTVGPRTPRLGFRDAPTYQDGQVVPGPGGGICQVSTTLYNAVLRAPGIKVVERSHHSMPVHYVPAGCDATVAYDSLDFKFRNDTSGPVLVAASTRNGRLSFGLYGVEPPSEKQVRVIAGRRRYSGDGFTVSTLRRVVEADGTVRNESLGSDTYRLMSTTPDATSTSTPRRRAARRRSVEKKSTVVREPAPAESEPSADAPGDRETAESPA
jgi:vancomycin resistance protein YoaR